MKERGPLHQAYQEIPQAFYESIVEKKGSAIAYGVATLASLTIYYHFIPNESLAVRAVGGAIYAIATLADNVSTVKALNAINSAKEAGIDVGDARENNFFLRNIRTGREWLKSPRHWLIEAIGITGVGYGGLSVGVSWGILKYAAALSNFRKAKRLNRAAEIATLNDSN